VPSATEEPQLEQNNEVLFLGSLSGRAEYDQWDRGPNNSAGNQCRVSHAQKREQQAHQRADTRTHNGQHDPFGHGPIVTWDTVHR